MQCAFAEKGKDAINDRWHGSLAIFSLDHDGGSAAAPGCYTETVDTLRNVRGGWPNLSLNARLKCADDSNPHSKAT